jgi:SagB-type dehydrogenase family enzyme
MISKSPARSDHYDAAFLGKGTPDKIVSPAEIYHENSKLRAHDYGLYSWISFVNASAELRHVISCPSTRYLGYPTIALPHAGPPPSGSFASAAVNRRSTRAFSGERMELATFAQLLYLGDGVVHTEEGDDGSKWLLRSAPSGGALYPIELYCLVRKITSLEPGLYFYSPTHHHLHLLSKGDPTQDLIDAIPSARVSIETSSVSIAMVCVLPRIRFKYGERAYRFALLETGHIAQNLLLAAQEMGMGALPIGGFLDDRLNALLRLDGLEEVSLYVVTVGMRS